MPETLNLNYYYGNEADQYSFYRIPKVLLTDRRYKGISPYAPTLAELTKLLSVFFTFFNKSIFRQF